VIVDSGDQSATEVIREALDDGALQHSGRSIGDIASGHVAEDILEALAAAGFAVARLTEEWGATCDQWSGGHIVRSSRAEAENDAAVATERDRGPYSCLEPPPPSIDDMRIETRSVSPWVES
jgi:di/tripeptidase